MAERLLAFLLLVSVAWVPSFDDARGETLRIATEGGYPPFNTVGPDGKPAGFDVDIAQAICTDLGATCEIVVVDWDGLIPALLAGKIDLIVASLSVTDARRRRIAFSRPYYVNTVHFIGPEGREITANRDGLRGLSIGAQRGARASLWLDETVGKETSIRLYETHTEALSDLQTGRLDLVLFDTFPLYDWLKTPEGQAYELKGPPVIGDDEVAIAGRKEDTDLMERIDAALNGMIADGRYRHINQRYFPFDLLKRDATP